MSKTVSSKSVDLNVKLFALVVSPSLQSVAVREPSSGQKAKWLRGSGDCIDFHWLVCAERDDDPPVLRLLRLNQKPPTARVTASKCTLQGKHTLLISTQVTNVFLVCFFLCGYVPHRPCLLPPPPSSSLLIKKTWALIPTMPVVFACIISKTSQGPKEENGELKYGCEWRSWEGGKKSLGKTNK